MRPGTALRRILIVATVGIALGVTLKTAQDTTPGRPAGPLSGLQQFLAFDGPPPPEGKPAYCVVTSCTQSIDDPNLASPNYGCTESEPNRTCTGECAPEGLSDRQRCLACAGCAISSHENMDACMAVCSGGGSIGGGATATTGGTGDSGSFTFGGDTGTYSPGDIGWTSGTGDTGTSGDTGGTDGGGGGQQGDSGFCECPGGKDGGIDGDCEDYTCEYYEFECDVGDLHGSTWCPRCWCPGDSSSEGSVGSQERSDSSRSSGRSQSSARSSAGASQGRSNQIIGPGSSMSSVRPSSASRTSAVSSHVSSVIGGSGGSRSIEIVIRSRSSSFAHSLTSSESAGSQGSSGESTASSGSIPGASAGSASTPSSAGGSAMSGGASAGQSSQDGSAMSVSLLLICGNGQRDADEQCDDGNAIDTDGCSNTCRLGTGIHCTAHDACTSGLCVNMRCALCQSDRQCGADHCASGRCTLSLHTVAPICGDSRIEGAEECDDGNTEGLDGCTPDCLLEIGSCGDDIVERLFMEQCERNVRSPLACRDTCRFILPFCGNGVLDPGEECDLGAGNSLAPSASCRPGCQRAGCGDGIAQRSAEECDDGNLAPGDGCDRTCRLERASPSALPATIIELPFVPSAVVPAQPLPYAPASPFPYAPVTASLFPPASPTHPPVGDTGPAALAIMAAGASAGYVWMRRRKLAQ